jgi:predicted O-linked N-acetylglucosamine transferase (SPINDLY family)
VLRTSNVPEMTLSLSDTLQRAAASYRGGRLDEAENLCRAILRTKAKHFDALHLLAVVRSELGRPQEALASYNKALAIKPDHAEALNNRGVALQDLNRFDDALASHDRALAIQPDYAEALYNRGNALKELKRPDEALASYDKALAVQPNHVDALSNRGVTLRALRRFGEALASYEKALALEPRHAQVLHNRGNVLRDLKRFEEALASYDKALSVAPGYAEILNSRGNALCDLNRMEDALASYDKAFALKPSYAEALNNRGVALRELKRFEEALASYDKALTIKPDYADALYNRGNVLSELKRFEESLASHERALAIKPDHPYAFSARADCALKSCDWIRTAELEDELRAHVTEQRSIITPFTLLGYWSDSSLQLKSARSFIEDKIPMSPPPLWSGTAYRHERLRIAYLSAGFNRSAMAHLIAELFELHDRSRFEVIGVSYGIDDKSEVRSRIIKSFDQFFDVRKNADRDVARLLNQLEVDIAVDLMGYTQDGRFEILAHRPAPVQISYLGYPGTMGADFIDYVIADNIVLPFEQQPFYSEKIVQLPDCYLVNDSQRRAADRTPTRLEAGLPEGAFVFCCFNNNYKITAPVFDAWMRLLHAVKGSVLWLLSDNAGAQTNLRKHAAARGIDPARLVFAGRVSTEDHLARHRLADLFLDTLPYNAHTTASDALWMGLPVLTCCGETFVGRVAASILHAVGLAELVTHSLADYEALAWRLASEPTLLQSVRRKINQSRSNCPLFDTDRFRRHMEGAYLRTWEIWQRGESPRAFRVDPL